MNVSEVMTREPTTCLPTDSVEWAARIMWEHDCGCVPVVDAGGRVVAMFTDRDAAMAAYTKNRPLGSMTVEPAMSRSVVSCRATDGLEDALRKMADAAVRRLPVVGDGDRLVGVLSLADVVQAIRAKPARTRRKWIDAVFASLADVTAPRAAPVAEERPAAAVR